MTEEPQIIEGKCSDLMGDGGGGDGVSGQGRNFAINPGDSCCSMG